jgi:hypothetical protein
VIEGVTELERLERRLAWAERNENWFSLGAAMALVIPWLAWWLPYGRLGTYGTIFPMFIGGAICKLGFAVYEARLDRRIRAIKHPALPAARVVVRPEPEPVRVTPIASAAPEVVERGEQPRLLK